MKLDRGGVLGDVGSTAGAGFVTNRFPNFFLVMRHGGRDAETRNITRRESQPKKTKRTNDVSPEAAVRLAEVAREMRELA